MGATNGSRSETTTNHLGNPEPLHRQHLRIDREKTGFQYSGCRRGLEAERREGNRLAARNPGEETANRQKPGTLNRRFQLSCSNLAWREGGDTTALSTLARLGFSGIEIAPTRLWPDMMNASPRKAAGYRMQLAEMGFSIPSMQAIYYGLDGVSLFNPDTHQQLIERTTTVAILAEAFECPVLVFGAPRMRDPGRIPPEQVISQAVPILERLAQIASDFGTTLCIEPNAREYGCGFVWTVKQAAELVRRIDHPGFGLHVDSAAMYLEEEDGPTAIREFTPLIRHYHVSEPRLHGLIDPKVDHQANLAALVESGYDKWVSLESTQATSFNHSVLTLSSWARSC